MCLLVRACADAADSVGVVQPVQVQDSPDESNIITSKPDTI